MDTGVRQIDMQHQELVSLINEMERAHAGGQSSMALDEILPSLTTYALFHFGDEELLLAQVAEGTAYAEHHLKEHRSFVDEIQRLIASRASQSDSDLVEVLTRYLADWLVQHISGTDRVLARLLLGKPAP
ncbi:MAG: hemerythrin family protein [Rhodoferax sp.]|nr:hemerythrin family protein [Rhodoferax sp.]MBP7492428.1 hemerythrin family protein [Rhodoferax sp.]